MNINILQKKNHFSIKAVYDLIQEVSWKMKKKKKDSYPLFLQEKMNKKSLKSKMNLTLTTCELRKTN